MDLDEIRCYVDMNKQFMIPALKERVEIALQSLEFHLENHNTNHVRKEMDIIFEIVGETNDEPLF